MVMAMPQLTRVPELMLSAISRVMMEANTMLLTNFKMYDEVRPMVSQDHCKFALHDRQVACDVCHYCTQDTLQAHDPVSIHAGRLCIVCCDCQMLRWLAPALQNPQALHCAVKLIAGCSEGHMHQAAYNHARE